MTDDEKGEIREAIRAQVAHLRNAGVDDSRIRPGVAQFMRDRFPQIPYKIWNEVLTGIFEAPVGPPAKPAVSKGSATSNEQSLDPMPSEFCKAPYRFVPLNRKIAGIETDVLNGWKAHTLHTRPLKGGISGTLAFRLAFDGPVLVGGEDQSAPAQIGDQYVIPGPTIRGCLRSVLEIASFAKLTQTHLNRRYGLRDFSHKPMAERRKNTKAGWLQKIGETYTITPCEFRLVKIRQLRHGMDNPKSHFDWLAKDIENKYDSFGMRGDDGIYDFSKKSQFFLLDSGEENHSGENIKGVPVFSSKFPTFSSPNISERDKQEHIDELQLQHENPVRVDEKTGKNKGNHKRNEAVFLDLPNAKGIQVSREKWEVFERLHSRKTKKRGQFDPDGTWKKLQKTLKSGKRIPVFFTTLDQDTVSVNGEVLHDFGLTRVYKQWHEYDTKQVLGRTGEKSDHLLNEDFDSFEPDFTEALLGYVHEPETTAQSETLQSHAHTHANRHLKGRVSFGFAKLSTETPASLEAPLTVVQAAPQPSFSPFYLASSSMPDWSYSDCELAGYKRYPVRPVNFDEVKNWFEHNPSKKPREMQSQLRFLVPQTDRPLVFEGQLKLHNISKFELGGLLWAMTLGGDSARRHNIGRGKTAGAGACQFQVQETLEGLKPDKGDERPTLQSAMQDFVGFMNKALDGKWMEQPTLKGLLKVTSPAWGARQNEDGKLNYLPLQQHRKARNTSPGSKVSALSALN